MATANVGQSDQVSAKGTYAELLSDLRTVMAQIRELDAQQLEKVKDAGVILQRIKDDVSRGMWTVACKDVKVSSSKANRYMDIAEYWDTPNFPRMGSQNEAVKWIASFRRRTTPQDGRTRRKKKKNKAPPLQLTMARVRKLAMKHGLEGSEDTIADILRELGAVVK